MLLLSELQALETFACSLPDAVIEEIPSSKSAVAKRTSASRAKRRGILILRPIAGSKSRKATADQDAEAAAMALRGIQACTLAIAGESQHGSQSVSGSNHNDLKTQSGDLWMLLTPECCSVNARPTKL